IAIVRSGRNSTRRLYLKKTQTNCMYEWKLLNVRSRNAHTSYGMPRPQANRSMFANGTNLRLRCTSLSCYAAWECSAARPRESQPCERSVLGEKEFYKAANST